MNASYENHTLGYIYLYIKFIYYKEQVARIPKHDLCLRGCLVQMIFSLSDYRKPNEAQPKKIIYLKLRVSFPRLPVETGPDTIFS